MNKVQENNYYFRLYKNSKILFVQIDERLYCRLNDINPYCDKVIYKTRSIEKIVKQDDDFNKSLSLLNLNKTALFVRVSTVINSVDNGADADFVNYLQNEDKKIYINQFQKDFNGNKIICFNIENEMYFKRKDIADNLSYNIPNNIISDFSVSRKTLLEDCNLNCETKILIEMQHHNTVYIKKKAIPVILRKSKVDENVDFKKWMINLLNINKNDSDDIITDDDISNDTPADTAAKVNKTFVYDNKESMFFELDNVLYFKAKHITKYLGYPNINYIIENDVDAENKIVNKDLKLVLKNLKSNNENDNTKKAYYKIVSKILSKYHSGATLITDDGLKSLILNQNKDEIVSTKRWDSMSEIILSITNANTLPSSSTLFLKLSSKLFPVVLNTEIVPFNTYNNKVKKKSKSKVTRCNKKAKDRYCPTICLFQLKYNMFKLAKSVNIGGPCSKDDDYLKYDKVIKRYKFDSEDLCNEFEQYVSSLLKKYNVITGDDIYKEHFSLTDEVLVASKFLINKEYRSINRSNNLTKKMIDFYIKYLKRSSENMTKRISLFKEEKKIIEHKYKAFVDEIDINREKHNIAFSKYKNKRDFDIYNRQREERHMDIIKKWEEEATDQAQIAVSRLNRLETAARFRCSGIKVMYKMILKKLRNGPKNDNTANISKEYSNRYSAEFDKLKNDNSEAIKVVVLESDNRITMNKMRVSKEIAAMEASFKGFSTNR